MPEDPQNADLFLYNGIMNKENYLPITQDLIRLVEENGELEHLLKKSILQAKETNPDPLTNPVDSLESYYAFLDRSVQAMPWEIHPEGVFTTLYDRIDQSMGCLYYICEQPLDELSGKGYYHNSLLYHEPYRSWFIRMIQECGRFLETPDSWNEQYFLTALANPDFHLGDGLYEDPAEWKSFNDFFARRLRDPSLRLIASPEDDHVVVSPADAAVQAFLRIDAESRIIAEEMDYGRGIAVKTATLSNIPALLGDSQYAHAFANGTLTHTFLDVFDYHRYHFPVSGTVKEIYRIPGHVAPGGVIIWDKDLGKYKEYCSEDVGWQSIETRGVIVLELNTGGLAAILPVGMCQVSSVNFEPEIVPGKAVRKGDPMGCFRFGGSNIIMIFSEEAGFTMTAEPFVHLDTGQAYGLLKKQ